MNEITATCPDHGKWLFLTLSSAERFKREHALCTGAVVGPRRWPKPRGKSRRRALLIRLEAWDDGMANIYGDD